MSAEEQRAAKAEALLQFREAKERFALLKNKAHKLAVEFEGMARVLKDRPETIDFPEKDAQIWKNYKGLGALVDDIKTTRTELQRLEEVLRQAGIQPE